MTAPDPVADLRTRFLVRLAEERALLEMSAREEDRIRLRDICHRIAGSAGMFGFATLSAAASQVEEAIDKGSDESELASLVGALLGNADRALRL